MRRAFDPCLGRHTLAGADIAAIIDLVPHHDPEERRAILGPRDRVPVGGGHVLDPLHPHGVVDVTERVDVLGERHVGAGEAVGLAHFASGFGAIPICHRMKANSSAVSFSEFQRPDCPPWPAPMLVFSSSRLSSVFTSRKRATHLAGSQ